MRYPTRRSFLGGAAAIPMAGSSQTRQQFRKRVHPLKGIARESLKIRDVKVTIMSYQLPPDRQWVTARAVTWKTDLILTEIFTDKGIAGIGETSPYSGPAEVKKVIDEQIRPTLIGQNPFDVEYLGVPWSGNRVFAGIDAACWDIIGKAKNTPVYKLLATDVEPQPHLRMYASGGVEYAWYKRPDDLIDEAVRHKEEGYTGFQIPPGVGMGQQRYHRSEVHPVSSPYARRRGSRRAQIPLVRGAYRRQPAGRPGGLSQSPGRLSSRHGIGRREPHQSI
jgi:hypothetical protein